MEITIALESDLDPLIALTSDCVTALRARGIDQWDDIYPNRELLARDVAAGTVSLLRAEGALVGTITLDGNLDPLWQGMEWSQPDAGAAAIHRVMVHPSRQGQGLARWLMAHAESQARENGSHSIRLDAFTANPASLRLYDALGYRRTGTATMRKGEFVCFEKIFDGIAASKGYGAETDSRRSYSQYPPGPAARSS